MYRTSSCAWRRASRPRWPAVAKEWSQLPRASGPGLSNGSAAKLRRRDIPSRSAATSQDLTSRQFQPLVGPPLARRHRDRKMLSARTVALDGSGSILRLASKNDVLERASPRCRSGRQPDAIAGQIGIHWNTQPRDIICIKPDQNLPACSIDAGISGIRNHIDCRYVDDTSKAAARAASFTPDLCKPGSRNRDRRRLSGSGR